MFAASKTASVSGGYQISRSLRFNSADSANLGRTPTTTSNQRTSTLSLWIKRGTLGAEGRIMANDSSGSATIFWVLFNSSDQIQIYTNGTGVGLVTTQVFRDPSAWYHIVVAVDTTQATSSNRIKLYVNGAQITAFTGTQTYYSLNEDIKFNSSSFTSYLGFFNTFAFNGYMTEVNWIDGQQLTPSSFGETNADTGVWQPKAFAGTYGTNGFYLNFSDNSNTTAATLGKDYSGNGNNWTPNGFLVSAGVNNDSLVDSPTSYGTDTGVGGTVRGNYCTINPLETTNATYAPTNGNLDVLNTGNFNDDYYAGTIGVSSGKWYFETTITGTWGNTQIGIHSSTGAPQTSTMYRTYVSSGNKATSDSSSTSYGNSFAPGDVIGVAYDLDSGKIWFSKNGTFQASGDPVAGTNAAFTDLSGTVVPLIVTYAQTSPGTSGHNLNFGQRPFNYTAPSGFKALCTQNLPTPTIGATTATQAGKYFNAVLYTGNNSTQSVTGVGFQPDLVWAKSRSNAYWHTLVDSVRGRAYILASNTTNADIGPEPSDKELTAFTSDGFNLGPDYNLSINSSGATFVAWNWKANGSGSTNTAGSITSTVSANTTSGFSIVTWSGTGAASATIGHGLGATPVMIIARERNFAGNWFIYTATTGNTQYLALNTTNGATTYTPMWDSTTPTSTVFTTAYLASTSITYVAYCFAPIAGFSAFGSYTGNGSADGPFVYCGFRPAFVLVKKSDSGSESWVIVDTTRNTSNVMNNLLLPNTSGAEVTATYIDAVSNGFKIRETYSSQNASGGTYIYMAFASAPLKFSLAR